MVETMITVDRLHDVELRLSRHGTNVLIWDIDDHKPDNVWAAQLQSKFSVYIIYVAMSASKRSLLPRTGKEEFLQKPPIFTAVTGARFNATIESQLKGLVARQRPMAMRDMVKTVSKNQKIVAIASSTGGTNALEALLASLPADIPPTVVVQHMPSGFTSLLADRLNALYPQEVREAQTGDFVMQGRMLIAPADKHMRLAMRGGKVVVECFVGQRIHGVMPAADVLFESVVEVMKNNAVGVVLTGMGNDGAKGLMQMRLAGCKNIGQDERSCVVYGMPKAAKDLGGIDYEIPLDDIPAMMLRLAAE
jgi:chemotaxis response regulator CheB